MSGAFCCIAMATIKLKNSQVKGKAPLAADLDVGGELAVNHHADDPGLFLKDTAGNVRKIAGVGSISTVDATETAKGIVELATAAETTTGTDATRAVHPAGLKVELDKKANLASPTFTGTPAAPTAAAGTNTTQVATTAFVHAATPDATEAAKGVVELATAAETTTGTDATRAVHPAGLKVELDKLKHWDLNGTKLTAQESGGTKRGASLDFASCLPNGASHILTDNNTHFIAEYRSTSGKVIANLPNPVLPSPMVATLDVTGIDAIFAVAGVAINFEGGSDCGAIGTLKLFEKGGTAPLALASQGCYASGLKTPRYQFAVTTHFTKKDLDPNKTYTLSLYAGVTVAQGPISAWDPSLSVFGLKIKA